MVEGGIPITTALDTITEDIENTQLQEILQHVSKKMQKGETFSDSLAEFPKVFNRLSCAMILAGETGGTLPESLRRMAEYFDSRDKLAKKVKGAMAYPVVVFIFIILIVTFIMTFIVPRFQLIFEQFGADLPAFTQGFMGFYSILRANIIYILGSVVLLIVSGVFASKTKKGHYLLCRILMSLPLIGKVFGQAFLVVFCKTMATLLAAGVSVLEVFDILSGMTNNDVIKNAITRTRERIVEGSNLSLSLAASGFFSNMVVKMVQVGEETGSISKVLERTAMYYERKVDSTITTVMNMLEPIMIVAVGGIVLVVVLALYLPIFSMSPH
jgi:type IV pilus assembly protein PilC